MKKVCIVAGLMMILGVIALPIEAKEKRGPMKPIAPLMIEHRLIERMVGVMEDYVKSIQGGKTVNPAFVDLVVDFFRMYGDKVHHGKEEDILFAALARKKLTPEHRKTLEVLIDDHVQARKLIAKLADAKEKYVKGDVGAADAILNKMKELTVLYRKHIELEDRHFFIPSLGYFTKEEMNAMLNEMWEFDRNMIHVKYREVVGQAKDMVGK